MTARPGFIRSDLDPIIGREHGPELDYARARESSEKLRDRLNTYFRRWEKTHGFRDGAGIILVPAGYQP